MRSLTDVEIPDTYNPNTDPTATLRFSVRGAVLFEPLLLALRKLARRPGTSAHHATRALK